MKPWIGLLTTALLESKRATSFVRAASFVGRHQVWSCTTRCKYNSIHQQIDRITGRS